MANLEGQILLGRYEILHIAGHGGMADVYRALDRKRSQEVAIKVLHEDLAEDPELRQRFRDEATALSRLTHKNIARLYEFEEEGDLAFLVMDFVNGTTLKKYLRDNRMSLGQALEVLEQVCPALNYAHEEGYVHRDIKSGNIMIQNDRKVLLSDFGIAKLVEEEATGSTSLIGTAGYMSPEQILGRPLDKTTDIYSLGVVAFEMVTGRRPFVGDTDQTTGGTFERVRWQQVRQAAPHPSEFNPDLPQEVDQAIIQALAKKPAERPRSAMEFLSEFKAGCLAIGVNAEKIEIDREKRTPSDRRDKKSLPLPPDEANKEKPRRNQRRVLAPLMILMAVLVCVVIFVAVLRAIPVYSTTIPGSTATQVAVIPAIAPTEVPRPTAIPQPANSPVPSPRPTTPAPTLTLQVPTPTVPPTNTPVPTAIPPSPIPTLTLPPPLPASTRTAVPPPPGVYVTNIRLAPTNPNNVEDVRFFITFLNTAGPLNFKWCVFIYRTGQTNPFGQTSCEAWVEFPLGSYEYGAANTWRFGTGQPCTDFLAQVQGVETDGKRLIFKTPNGSENATYFRVCP
jgi:eukaryotic-like serine/threonine-protein kinase